MSDSAGETQTTEWDRTTLRQYAPQDEEAMSENREPHQLFVFVMQRPAKPSARKAKL